VAAISAGRQAAIETGSRQGGISPAADNTSVPADTAPRADATDFEYRPDERIAIDDANEAFGPVVDADIEAGERSEDIEGWTLRLVRGVRAIRDRAMRETGALNRFDSQYRTRFGDLLNAEPIGPWLLDKNHRAFLHAVHYLGDDDNLDKFMRWRETMMTEDDHKKWRSLRTQVDHFKKWREGTVVNCDRRTSAQREIEQVRAEGHKAEAALLAEVEQARHELVTSKIETTETLSMALDHAGPEKLVEAIMACPAQGFARAVYELLGKRLKEPTA
jgi:hypothetical protein